MFQEFINVVAAAAVAVPEGGAAWSYLLLGGLSCCGAIFLRYRNQIAKSSSN